MGALDGPHPEDGEGPVRDVFVDPFAIAHAVVSNRDFRTFTEATGYETRAERLGWSFVFHLFLRDPGATQAPRQARWWRAVEGANWAAPNGPDGDAADHADHPVTHIAQEDALAYCHWSRTRLPTEAEWEFAARGGLSGRQFPWGDDLEPAGIHRANVWQGSFPQENTADDGFAGTAPVTAYAPNGFGLYNMTGNVWERVADRFTRLHSPRPGRNPAGPLNGAEFVAKGGSYLCHASYCQRYRVSSRQALAPDATAGNVGFRVAANTAR